MNLLILANTTVNKNYDNIFNAIDKLEYNLIGFISLDNEKNSLKGLKLPEDKKRIIDILADAKSFLKGSEIKSILHEMGFSETDIIDLEKPKKVHFPETNTDEKIVSIQKQMFLALQEINANSKNILFWIKFWSIFNLVCLGLAIIVWLIVLS